MGGRDVRPSAGEAEPRWWGAGQWAEPSAGQRVGDEVKIAGAAVVEGAASTAAGTVGFQAEPLVAGWQ